MYLDAKNLYGWEMSQKLSVLPVNGFNPNKAGLFEGSFSWGWGQLTPRLYFKKILSNINVTLYNC